MKTFALLAVPLLWFGNAAAAELAFPAPGEAIPESALGACRPAGTPGERLCTPAAAASGEIAAGIPAVEVTYHLAGNELNGTTAFFREERFEDAIRALRSSWGESEVLEEQLRAGMGATFTNVMHVWRRDGNVWFAEQFAGRITRSALVRTTPAKFDALLEARRRLTERGSRSL